MALEDDLDDKTLLRLSRDISTVSMRAVAIIYLNFEKHMIETIMDDNGYNQAKTSTDILNKWKKRSYDNNRQVGCEEVGGELCPRQGK